MTLSRLKIQYPTLSDVYRDLLQDAYQYLYPLRKNRRDRTDSAFDDYFLDWMTVLDPHTDARSDVLQYFEQNSAFVNQLVTVSMEHGCHRFAAGIINLARFLTLCTNLEQHLLLAVACGLGFNAFQLESVDLSTVRFLLHSGANPNDASNGMPKRPMVLPGASIWHRLLLKMWSERSKGCDLDSDSVAHCPENTTPGRNDINADLVRLMVEYGADLNAQVCVLGGECHYHGHDRYCTAFGCSGHTEHKLMSVQDILNLVLTGEDLLKAQFLMSKHSTDEAREELREARRIRIETTPFKLLSEQDLELLGQQVEINHAAVDTPTLWWKAVEDRGEKLIRSAADAGDGTVSMSWLEVVD